MFRTTLGLAAAALVSTTALAQTGPLLFDNGPFITGTGNGFGGADTSSTEAGTAVSLGFKENGTSPLRVADDFSLTGGGGAGQKLSSLDFYGVQSQSSNFTTHVQFGALYIAIYDTNPSTGGVIIAGDFTTNRLQSSTWTGAYRCSSGTTSAILFSQARPIIRLTADMSWAPRLRDGSYWIVVSAVGDVALSTNPNPQTILVTPRPPTANGIQLFNGAWVSTTDYPFRLYGYCPGDFNTSGVVSVQDIFDFLAAYFAGDLTADINGTGGVSVQDIFDYLAAYFAACP
jgi:hypothetical protein